MVGGFDLRALRSVPIVALALALVVSTMMVFSARGSSHGETYWACLYGGSLSQVSTTEPSNCGRGTKISWNSQGEQGPPGDGGEGGLSGFERAQETHELLPGGDSATYDNYDVACATGKIAIACGYKPSSRSIEVLASHPSDNGRRWVIRARNTSNSNTQELTVHASCIDEPETDPI